MKSNQQAGMTLIELLFALIILTIGILLISSLQNLTLKTTHGSSHTRELTRNATNILELAIADPEEAVVVACPALVSNGHADSCQPQVWYCMVVEDEDAADMVQCNDVLSVDTTAVFVRVSLTDGDETVTVQELRGL